MPEWSNNLSHLLFIGLHSEIYKYYLNNNDTVRVTNLNRNNIYSFYNRYPKYFSDNTKIIFLSQPKEELPNIHLIDSNGDNLQKLTEDGVEGDSGTAFSLSPDGRYIVYTKYDWNDWSYANGTIWILDINSGNKTQLTFNEPPNKKT
jgi:Tol biopolymer transport system component